MLCLTDVEYSCDFFFFFNLTSLACHCEFAEVISGHLVHHWGTRDQ